jgi:hypothetical protein
MGSPTTSINSSWPSISKVTIAPLLFYKKPPPTTIFGHPPLVYFLPTSTYTYAQGEGVEKEIKGAHHQPFWCLLLPTLFNLGHAKEEDSPTSRRTARQRRKA